MDDGKFVATIAGTIVLVLGGSISGCMYVAPKYNVYSQQMEGEAQLSKATYTRRTKVLEAQADLDASQLAKQKRIIDAQGVSAANKIIADGLGGPEGYLRFEYIQMLRDSNGKQIIYIPTEGALPLLEAGKR